jgi:hypothetical protein
MPPDTETDDRQLKVSWTAKVHPNMQEAGSRIGLWSLSASKPLTFRTSEGRPAMVSIRTVCCHGLAKARVCPTAAVWGDHTGETMAKLLNELGRGSKAAIPPSFVPCPLALADRDRREALRDQQSLTAAFFGDPLPGLSALDRRRRERPH